MRLQRVETRRTVKHPIPWNAATSLVLLGLLQAAIGCRVGPEYEKPGVLVRPGWTEQTDPRLAPTAEVDVNWWTVFNDVALNQLVKLSHEQNLPLQIAGLRILEARAALGIAYANQYPINTSPVASAAGVGRSQHAPNSALVDRHYGDYQVGFDAVWEVDFWRKYRRGVWAAKAEHFATMSDYDTGVVALTAEVARTYAALRTYQTLVQLGQENVVVQEEGLRIAESRFRNGSTSELDLAQQRNLLESTRATIPELVLGQQTSKNALCTLIGRPTGVLDAMLGQPGVIPVAPRQVAVSVPAELLRRRPDIRGVEFRAIAQCQRIGMAKADLFPKFELFGALGTETSSGGNRPSGYSSFSNLFGPGSLFYTFGLNVSWPVLAYPRIYGNIRVQDARFQQAVVDYQNTVIRAAQEVEDSIAGFLREQDSSVFALNAATAAAQAVKLAMVQYREGAVDFQRVLDAQRALLSSQNTLARTRSAVATNLIALYKALGGGWQVRQGAPVVPINTQYTMAKRTNWGKYLPKAPKPVKVRTPTTAKAPSPGTR
jgi:NodT family efflux transporter outer membrane factor (OMF) lipoprotein